MSRSYDSRQVPSGPYPNPHKSGSFRGPKRTGQIRGIVPGDDIEVARDIARLWALTHRHRRTRSIATLHIKVCADTGLVVAGDGKFIFAIAEDMHNFALTTVEIFVTTVSSSGIVQVQIRNITQTQDMLTTRVQVDASEKNSKTASTKAKINVANASVKWADEISIDVDAAGTGAKGLGVILEFTGA